MKRLFAMLLTLSSLILLVSCTGREGPEVQSTPVSADIQTPTLEDQHPTVREPEEKTDETSDHQTPSPTPEYFELVKNADGYGIRQCADVTLPEHLEIPGVYKGCQVTSIESNGFSDATNVVSVELPDSIESIGESAFSPNMKKLICSGDLRLPGDLAGQLTSLVLTSGEFVDPAAHLSNLEELEIGSGVLEIGTMAFLSATNLKTVTIRNGVTKIGHQAFDQCKSLTSVTLPDSVLTIGMRAFEGCTSLQSLHIGKNVSEIGQGAFAGCDSLVGNITVASGNRNFYAKDGSLYTAKGEDLTNLLFG